MNDICAKIEPIFNMTMLVSRLSFQFTRNYSRPRRSVDIDEDYNGNYSSSVKYDEHIDEIPKTTPASMPHDSDYNTELMDQLKNTTEMIWAYMNKNYDDFRHSSEIYAMTTLASLGLFLNFLSLIAIVLDRRTALTSRMVHGAYVVAQQVFLVFVICFLHLKKASYYARYSDLEAINYFTIFLGFVQFIQPWMLFAVAGYVRGCLENLFGIGKAPGFPVALTVVSLLFAVSLFSIYLPPIRVQLHQSMYVLCDAPPIEKIWNLDRVDYKSTELVNVFIYNLSYILAVYLMPSILIAYRSKGIVDLLHALQEQPKVLAKYEELACTSLVISLTCHLHLVFVTIKIVVFLFNILELFFVFVGDAFVFFQYLSIFANLLIITGTGSHVFVLMRYNLTVKYFLLRVAYKTKMSIYWLSDRLPKWKRTSSKQPDLAMTDASSRA